MDLLRKNPSPKVLILKDIKTKQNTSSHHINFNPFFSAFGKNSQFIALPTATERESEKVFWNLLGRRLFIFILYKDKSVSDTMCLEIHSSEIKKSSVKKRQDSSWRSIKKEWKKWNATNLKSKRNLVCLATNGPIKYDDKVLIRTNWSRKLKLNMVE